MTIDETAHIVHDSPMEITTETITTEEYLNLFVTEKFSMTDIAPAETRHVVMLVYPGMFALDMVGPLAVLQGLVNTKVHQLWKSADSINCTGLTIVPTGTFDNLPEKIEVLLIPGGSKGTLEAMRDPDIVAFVQTAATRAKYVTSVCTGSLLLGVAGLLEGKRATTHWSAMDVLPKFGATPVAARYVEDGNVMTAAGVSAGIDFALALATKMVGEPYARGLQLDIEYDPAPPFNAGSPAGAGAAIADGMARLYAPLMAEMSQVAMHVD